MTGNAWWPLALAPMAGLVTVLAVPLLRPYLTASGMIDLPGSRRSHSAPTPRGGGLAMAAGCLPPLGLLAWFDAELWSLVIAALALTVLGWLDDRHELGVKRRLLVHCLVGVILVASIGGIERLLIGQQLWSAFWPLSLLAVLLAVWLINLHNFMDGADGLACSQGVWVALAFGLLLLLHGRALAAAACFCLALSCTGFLVWNRPPARVFMGDSGSLLVGGMVAWMCLFSVAVDERNLWVGLIITAVFVVDASLTLLRRIVRGERWYTPHRQHAYQVLISHGWKHGQVLMLYVATNLLLVLPASVMAIRFRDLGFWLAGLVYVLLTLAWAWIQVAAKGEHAKP
ncbi:MAG: glycosyl transferase [Wenzhouxiangella sp.]|nr:glycosyl transferase [Wenzhouxiangella sp.]TVR95977.1 MAG: glycosyl transferase [Wenzhouxiangellaceae bacterium]